MRPKPTPYSINKRVFRRKQRVLRQEKRKVARFKGDLARLHELALALENEEQLDSFLGSEVDMSPTVKAEVRKLILALRKGEVCEPTETP